MRKKNKNFITFYLLGHLIFFSVVAVVYKHDY